ncbi:MAG: periplasmic heavy metal sensor [Cyclobacteriaceae bacterium]
MKKQMIIMLAILTIGVFGTIAQPRGQKGGMDQERGKGMKEQLIAKLELTEAQQTKIEDLRVSHYKESLPLKNILGEKRAALKTQTTTANIDQKKVDRTIEEIGELETKLLKAKTNHQIAVRSMLDEKQQMMFDQMQNHRQGQGRNKKGPRGK